MNTNALMAITTGASYVLVSHLMNIIMFKFMVNRTNYDIAVKTLNQSLFARKGIWYLINTAFTPVIIIQFLPNVKYVMVGLSGAFVMGVILDRFFRPESKKNKN